MTTCSRSRNTSATDYRAPIPMLDLLMQHKRAWMDANGITAYMK
ncbi:MAG: hypothetical protein ACLR4Z_08065 [Butyricicoccaceae bacterium]